MQGLNNFPLGSTVNPEVLRLWTLSKDPGKGMLLLQDGTVTFEPPRRIFLTQDVNTSSFAVTVSRFKPGPDDATAFRWADSADGSERIFELPPYYISDMAEARVNIQQFVREARTEFTRTLLINGNPIIQKTFNEAERYCKVSNVSTPLKAFLVPAPNGICRAN